MIATFSPEARGQIAAALLRGGPFDSTDDVREIARQLPFHSEISGGSTLTMSVTGLVSLCSLVPRGMMLLLDAMRLFGKRPLPDEVFTAFDAAMPMALKWKFFYDLKAILSSVRVPDDHASEAWEAITSNENARQFCSENEAYFSCLVDCAANKRITPPHKATLLGLIELCRGSFAPAAAEAADRWERTFAVEHGLALDDIRQEARRQRQETRYAAVVLAASPDGVPVLLVCVSPCRRSTPIPTYFVKSWLCRGGDRQPLGVDAALQTADGTVPENVLEKAVGGLVEVALADFRDLTKMRIEIILPFRLLAEAVDEWKIASGYEDVPIGERFPVVMRSWDRLYHPRFKGDPRQRWEAKWRQLDAELAEKTRRFWGCQRKVYGRELRETLEEEKILTYLSVHLTPAEPVIQPSEVLLPALSAGLPIMLWLRGHTGEPGPARAALTEQFWPGFPGEWPQRMHTLRVRQRRAGHAGACHCTGFALLWDNPRLLPPEQIGDGSTQWLQAPTL